MWRSRVLAAALALTWLVGGCTSSTSSDPSHDQPYDPSGAEPPPLLLHTAQGTAAVRPWTYCWRTPGQAQCADGSPRPPYAHAGTWLVEVHGTGPEGDVAATFRWRTTRSGRGTHLEPGPECARPY